MELLYSEAQDKAKHHLFMNLEFWAGTESTFEAHLKIYERNGTCHSFYIHVLNFLGEKSRFTRVSMEVSN